MTRALVVAALAAGVALLPAPAPGCAIAPSKGGYAATVGEVAVIVWDDQAGVEHFARSAVFRGSSADFGFLVPTPGRPTLADAPGPISQRLESLTVPRVVTKQKLASLGCAAEPKSYAYVGAALPAGAAPAPVQVVEQKRVGDYDAAVLTATDPTALNGWLGKHGYESRPALADWLKGYVDGAWHLTAFKVANPGGQANAPGGHLRAVRLSFPTAVPIYPYQEPADAAGPGTPGTPPPRLLKLFVLAPYRVDARAGLGAGSPTAFQVRTVWAGPIDRPAFEATAAAVGLSPAETAPLAGRAWTLTEFEDGSSSRAGMPDLAFRASPDQSPVERPPTVVYREVYWPYYAAGAGLVVGGPVAVWLAWRIIRRLLRSLPAAPLD